MEIVILIMPLLVLLNFIMICSLVKRAHRFEKVVAKYENRERTKLERDTMETLTLLRTGKTEEAKSMAEKIIRS